MCVCVCVCASVKSSPAPQWSERQTAGQGRSSLWRCGENCSHQPLSEPSSADSNSLLNVLLARINWPKLLIGRSLLHTIYYLGQISQKSRGSRPEWICASILCHIHSATHWTQEVRQTSSDWHDVHCLFSPRHDILVTGERAVRHTAARRAWTARAHSSLLAVLIFWFVLGAFNGILMSILNQLYISLFISELVIFSPPYLSRSAPPPSILLFAVPVFLHFDSNTVIIS